MSELLGWSAAANNALKCIALLSLCSAENFGHHEGCAIRQRDCVFSRGCCASQSPAPELFRHIQQQKEVGTHDKPHLTAIVSCYSASDLYTLRTQCRHQLLKCYLTIKTALIKVRPYIAPVDCDTANANEIPNHFNPL